MAPSRFNFYGSRNRFSSAPVDGSTITLPRLFRQDTDVIPHAGFGRESGHESNGWCGAIPREKFRLVQIFHQLPEENQPLRVIVSVHAKFPPPKLRGNRNGELSPH
jgi:hypothetical protein